ncbi:MAG: hypothetical protein DRR00_06485 [Candidatus Parabeggiatoa sp. nov. 3]|nr:MAG: hypothetical protein DRR00_06485 [Gammaproteobacteria bacterium]RKZ65880.1 MAG: hypothetical protein DRQ99_11365 [Gammaproteobacteria bacterium]
MSCSSDKLSSSDTIDNVTTLKQEATNNSAFVDEIEMMIIETFPVQVNVIAKGYFHDDCTKIVHITEELRGNTISLKMITVRQTDKVCSQDIKPFEEIIPLNIAGFSADIYTVNVNNKSAIFELGVDNIIR